MDQIGRAKKMYSYFLAEKHGDCGEDFHLDMLCYFINTCLEYLLKYLLEMNGIRAEHTHVLRYLLTQLPDSYAQSEWYGILRAHAGEVDDWGTQTRYGTSFVAAMDTVLDLEKCYLLLLADAENTVVYESTYESKISKILMQLRSSYTVEQVIRYLPDTDMPEEIMFDAVKTAIKLLSSK